MIVNIRGYSGSGKSTAVKNIMSLYNDKEVLITRKHRPLITRLYNTLELNECIVIGPYDDKNQTLGCDTIAYNEQIKLLIEYFDDLKYDVLCEGMMLSTNHTIISELCKHRDVSVIYLDVPHEQIIKQRKQRASDNNRSTDFKHDISVMNNKTVEKSLDKIQNTCNNVYKIGNDKILETFISIVHSPIRKIITENMDDRFHLMCRYDTMTSKKLNDKKFNMELFDVKS
jgi:thymidylate kinase